MFRSSQANGRSMIRVKKSRQIQPGRLRQRGYLMLEAALSLLIAALAAFAGYQATQRADDAARATSQADVLASIRQAAETLIFEKYVEYQAGLPVTRNGVTLAPGAGAGQAMRPTVAQLRTMALGIDGAADTGFYKSLSAAGYRIEVQRVPAGCENAPNPANGSACNISGTVCFDQPVRAYGAAAGEEDGLAIGKMLGRIGGNGGASVLGAAATITGTGGGWTAPNPIAGQPAGIVCARFGFGASGFGNFLRVGDPRDPNFQGGETVSGTLPSGYTLQVNGSTNITGSVNIGGTTTFGGDIILQDPATGTVCVRILRAGQIDINCQGILNAKAGTFTGPLGVARIGDTGTAYAIDTNNRIRGELGFFSAVGSVFGDNTLGVRAAGSLFTVQTASGMDALAVHDQGRVGARNYVATPALGLSDPVTAFSSCTSPSGEVAATQVTSAATTVLRALVGGGLASCANGQWTPVGQIAAPGGACSPDGVGAVSSVDGRALTCRNGVWMLLNDLLSSFVLVNTFFVTDGQLVTKPTCGPMGSTTGQPLGILLGQTESSKNSSFERRLIDVSGSQWRVVLTNSDGTSLTGSPAVQGILTAYCYY
jgi:hypothetical protein